MDVSSFSATSRLCFWPLPSSEDLLFKKISLAEPYPASLSIFPVKRSSGVLRSYNSVLSNKQICLQVSCSRKSEITVVQGRYAINSCSPSLADENYHHSFLCMDEIYDTLAKRILPPGATASTDSNYKHIVGIAGPPGAGKSTIASEVAQRVNKLWPQISCSFDSQVEPPAVATVLPMDGFHLYRHQLDAMEDPKEAHARRGAPWTFDPELFLSCLKTLRDQGSVYAPSFDHGVGDPIKDDIFVNLQHKVVIVEGNYLYLEEGAWKEISSIFDEKWFVDVDIDKAMQRVLRRHISTGKPENIARSRVKNNDRPNAELIMETKNRADLIIKSIDF